MSIPILVVSCDAYQDVWHPFFHCFFKNWSDCPFPVHLVSNKLKYSDERVSSIFVGTDVDYSSNLINALNQIPEEWIIFWVEDRPPARQVDTSRLIKLIELAQSKNAGYLKLIPINPPAPLGPEEIGEIPKGSRYRISMTVALWKKSTLLKILKAGESAWEIEKGGGVARSNEIDDKFYALPMSIRSNPPLIDIHLISKGKIISRGADYLEKEGVLDDLSNRLSVTFWRNLYIEAYDSIWDIYYLFTLRLKYWFSK